MSSPVRGHALIIANSFFYTEAFLSSRTGSDVDTVRISTLFKSLGFETRVVHDYTAEVGSIYCVIYLMCNLSMYDCVCVVYA